MEFLKKIFKKPLNKELDRLEKEAGKRKSTKDKNYMSKNYGEEQRKKSALAEIELLRKEVLMDIAEQAERKIHQENVINKAMHQIEYNQNKVDRKQAKLQKLEDEWDLFHKRLSNL